MASPTPHTFAQQTDSGSLSVRPSLVEVTNTANDAWGTGSRDQSFKTTPITRASAIVTGSTAATPDGTPNRAETDDLCRDSWGGLTLRDQTTTGKQQATTGLTPAPERTAPPVNHAAAQQTPIVNFYNTMFATHLSPSPQAQRVSFPVNETSESPVAKPEVDPERGFSSPIEVPESEGCYVDKSPSTFNAIKGEPVKDRLARTPGVPIAKVSGLTPTPELHRTLAGYEESENPSVFSSPIEISDSHGCYVDKSPRMFSLHIGAGKIERTPTAPINQPTVLTPTPEPNRMPSRLSGAETSSASSSPIEISASDSTKTPDASVSQLRGLTPTPEPQGIPKKYANLDVQLPLDINIFNNAVFGTVMTPSPVCQKLPGPYAPVLDRD